MRAIGPREEARRRRAGPKQRGIGQENLDRALSRMRFEQRYAREARNVLNREIVPGRDEILDTSNAALTHMVARYVYGATFENNQWMLPSPRGWVGAFDPAAGYTNGSHSRAFADCLALLADFGTRQGRVVEVMTGRPWRVVAASTLDKWLGFSCEGYDLEALQRAICQAVLLANLEE